MGSDDLPPLISDTDEIALTLALMDLWPTGDAERMSNCFASDGTYQDIPFSVIHQGRPAIRRYLEIAFAKFSISQVVHRIAQHGNWVLTERTDFVAAGGERIEIPVMGSVQIVTGLVQVWRDYYQFPARLTEIVDRSIEGRTV